MYSRRDEDGAIAYDVRYELGYADACFFGGRSVRKRLRAHGIDAEAMCRSIQEDGHSHLFDFDYKITMRNNRWAEVRGVVNTSHINLFCDGPQANEIVAKVNAALHPWLKTEQEIEHRRRAEERKETIAKRRKIRRPTRERFKNEIEKRRHAAELEKARIAERKALRKERRAAEPKKRERKFVQAPISLKKNEVIAPMLRRTTIAWSDATAAIVSIYGIQPTEKTPAREIVSDHMMRSLKRNGGRFVMIKRGDFKLRFDLQAEFRGDFTPLKISCTKDRHHPLYRAIRQYFYDRFVGLSLVQQTERRHRMFSSVAVSAKAA